MFMTPDIVRDFRKHGRASRYAFGWKGPAIEYAIDRGDDIRDDMNCLRGKAGSDYEAGALLTAYAATLPGLGLVKGGFLAQLAYGVSGCIDVHNARRYGVNVQRFAGFDRLKREATRAARVNEYMALIDKSGGCEALWDSWCEYVAKRTPARYPGGSYEVSRLHVEAICE